MEMKNIAILLIFLLCVLGLMVGVYYSEANESGIDMGDYDEIIHEDENGTIIIHLEKKDGDNFINKYFI